jgi:hypothetical protein
MKSETTSTTNLKQGKPPIIREQIIHGTRYVYQDIPYWDKEKKQTRHKRKYIGHYNKEGIFISHDNLKKDNENTYKDNNYNSKFTRSSTLEINNNRPYTHKLVGATYLLEQIVIKTGILDDLKAVFPESYKEILSLVYYITIENNNSLYKFDIWAREHEHPSMKILSSQRISELLNEFNDYSKFEFCKRQAKRRLENECLAYDLTSISSYSNAIRKVKYGHNKDGDKLPQINVALILGETSLLPVYYRILPGNISDVSTIDKLIIDSTHLGIDGLKFVMDRGFYSASNIENLIDKTIKFTIGAKNNLKKVDNFINEIHEKIKVSANFIHNYNVYGSSKIIYFPKKRAITNFNIVNECKSRVYMHLYLDSTRAE